MKKSTIFGLHLKAWRRAKFTQDELAQRLGVSRMTVVRWEAGLFDDIRPENLRKLGEVLGLGDELIQVYKETVA